MRLWKLEYGAFIQVAQSYLCGRLIIVPLTTFRRLADKIGDPQGELTFLYHVPRSGSTLLMQVCLSIRLVRLLLCLPFVIADIFLLLYMLHSSYSAFFAEI